MALLADICSRHSRHLTLYVSGHCGRNAPEFIKSSFTLERATTVFRQNSSERKHGYFLYVYVYIIWYFLCVNIVYIYYISIGVFFSRFILVLGVHPAEMLDRFFHSSRSPSRSLRKPEGPSIGSCMGSAHYYVIPSYTAHLSKTFVCSCDGNHEKKLTSYRAPSWLMTSILEGQGPSRQGRNSNQNKGHLGSRYCMYIYI